MNETLSNVSCEPLSLETDPPKTLPWGIVLVAMKVAKTFPCDTFTCTTPGAGGGALGCRVALYAGDTGESEAVAIGVRVADLDRVEDAGARLQHAHARHRRQASVSV